MRFEKVNMFKEIEKIKKKQDVNGAYSSNSVTDSLHGNNGYHVNDIVKVFSSFLSNGVEKNGETTIKLNKSKVGKNKKPSPSERDSIIYSVSKGLMSGEFSQGEALKKLRINVLSLDQDAFSKLVGVSRKTISDIETDKGNYSVNTLSNVFKPFGFRVSVIPVSIDLLKRSL